MSEIHFSPPRHTTHNITSILFCIVHFCNRLNYLIASIPLLHMWSVSQYLVLFARVFHKASGVRRMFKTKKMPQNHIIINNNTRKIRSSIQKYSPSKHLRVIFLNCLHFSLVSSYLLCSISIFNFLIECEILNIISISINKQVDANF